MGPAVPDCPVPGGSYAATLLRQLEAPPVTNKNLRKGTRIRLRSGQEAVVDDNRVGRRSRQIKLLDGRVKEVPIWDIKEVILPGGVEAIELTGAEKTSQGSAEAMDPIAKSKPKRPSSKLTKQKPKAPTSEGLDDAVDAFKQLLQRRLEESADQDDNDDVQAIARAMEDGPDLEAFIRAASRFLWPLEPR